MAIVRESQPQAAAAAHEPPGDAEKAQAQAQAFGFPPAGLPGQGEHLGPGQQLAGQGHDLAPDLVLGVAFEREVPQPGVLRIADPVLAPGSPPVPELMGADYSSVLVRVADKILGTHRRRASV
jgi:hypothetical protein